MSRTPVTGPADSEELVVLVDEDDRVIGTEGKMAAPIAGKLHRAVSVFVFNTDGKLLLLPASSLLPSNPDITFPHSSSQEFHEPT